MEPNDFPEGLIEVDSESGQNIGFTSDKFVRDGEVGSQLFKRGDCMYIQAIEVSKNRLRQGHFNNLLKQLWNCGFTVKVPNPLPKMYKILKKKGFEEVSEQTLTTTEPKLNVMLVKVPPSQAVTPIKGSSY